jgi:integrase
VPVIADLEPIVAEIRATSPDEYVLPPQRWRDPPVNTAPRDLPQAPVLEPGAAHARHARRQARRHQAHIHPHLMRHAFGDHVARYAGIKNAQALLGHATVGTTETYVGKPTLDELAVAVATRPGVRQATQRRAVCGS